MRFVISIVVVLAFAACGDDSETSSVDAGGGTAPVDGATNPPPIDAIDAQLPDANPDSQPPDSGLVEYGVSGCWITHTSDGETQIDLVEQPDGQVIGTQSYQEYMYSVENGVVDGDGLVFTVFWSDFDFTCNYTFTEVSADALSGTVDCGDTIQDITADRTCT